MRILIQRVLSASVHIEQKEQAKIGPGLLVFVGIHKEDTQKEAEALIQKCLTLRLFSDKNDKMNLSIEEVEGEILIVSQFTLYGNCFSGRRPEFTQSAHGDKAKALYHYFVEQMVKKYPKIKTGVFAAKMEVQLINDGPVTFMVEKKPD